MSQNPSVERLIHDGATAKDAERSTTTTLCEALAASGAPQLYRNHGTLMIECVSAQHPHMHGQLDDPVGHYLVESTL